MKVEVIGNFQVSHEGTVWRPGEVADVPDEVVKEWLASGWVTEAPARAKVVEAPKKAAPKKTTGARTK